MNPSIFIIEVQWDRSTSDSPNPASRVGPFRDRYEAVMWGERNIQGSWHIVEVLPTYAVERQMAGRP